MKKKLDSILNISIILSAYLLLVTLISSLFPLTSRYLPIYINSAVGHSMAPNLGYIGVDCKVGGFYFEKFNRGQIVLGIFTDNQGKIHELEKRVIGLPGETIEIKGGVTYIDNYPLDEPYLSEDFNKLKRDFGPVKLCEDEYYLMGDNRDNSYDSRFLGPIKKERIVGLNLFRIDLVK